MVVRINKTKDYTVMSNSHFKEKGMSLKSKGLLSLMLSLPENWDYSISGLVALSQDGKDSISNALKELERFGYLTRTQCLDEKGRFDGYDYNIYETKQSPLEECPLAENPSTENPSTENPPQYNTNTNKELNNKHIDVVSEIVNYLNEKAKTSYKKTTESTKRHILARLHDGFTLDNIKSVIDKKVKEWKDTEFEKYIRPETLFGTKFESYLNSKINNKDKILRIGREYNKDELNSLFDNIEEVEL